MRTLAAVLLGLAAIAACSGGGDEGDTTTTIDAAPTAPSASASSTIPPSESRPPPPSSSTTAVGSAQTGAPTSASSVTSVSSEPQLLTDAARAAIIDAVENSWRLFNEAFYDPTSDAKTEAALATMTGQLELDVRARLDDARANNRRAVPATVVASSLEVDPASITLDATGSVATVEFCRVDSDVLVVTAGNPDGTDRVIDDSINAYRERETYILVEGRWLNSMVESLQVFEGSLTCVA